MTRRLAVAGLLAAGTLALVVYGGSSLTRVWQMKQEVERLERDIGVLRGEADRLSTDIDQLRTDPEALEKAARAIGLVKPGEKILKLPPTPGG